MSIIINNLSYVHPDREELFSGVSFSVPDGEKASLVGDNGSGKSTLIKILSGMAVPSDGNFSITGSLWVVPQHFGQYDGMTVAVALGIEAKLRAIEAITGGSTDEKYYSALADDWSVEQRAREALNSWELCHISLCQNMETLSGGEKTKVFLAGIALHSPDTILMDEPTNHLDAESRRKLYELISRSKATMLIVSHDRSLLDILDTTFEMSSTGVTRYGGNYGFYREARETKQGALREQLAEKEKSRRAAEQKARLAMERKQKTDSRAPANMKKEGIPRIMKKTLTDRAASTAKKLAETHDAKIETISDEAREIRAMITPDVKMKMGIHDAGMHEGKIMVEAKDINFHYPDSPELWAEPLSFLIRSGERVAIEGGNGTGKTTLLSIMLGNIEPTEGTIFRAATTHILIDQEYSLIDDSLTVYGQLEKWNIRNLPEHFLKTELHRFLFPAAVWDKPCSALSGGEKLKLTLCCMEVAEDRPGLFILDEPTNNLDIRSMEILTAAVRAYKGTVIVISHDAAFLDDIGVTRKITLMKNKTKS